MPNPEHPELMQELPMFREKWIVFVEEFKDAMARQLERKKKEHSEWKTVVDGALGEGDERARVAVAALEDDRKRAFQVRSIQTFFTHRPVSTFDRVPFQLTAELFLYGTTLRRTGL